MSIKDELNLFEKKIQDVQTLLLNDADERYKRKLDDLQREYAAERNAITNAFGMDTTESEDLH